jgi:hypothetical protein
MEARLVCLAVGVVMIGKDEKRVRGVGVPASSQVCPGGAVE